MCQPELKSPSVVMRTIRSRMTFVSAATVDAPTALATPAPIAPPMTNAARTAHFFDSNLRMLLLLLISFLLSWVVVIGTGPLAAAHVARVRADRARRGQEEDDVQLRVQRDRRGRLVDCRRLTGDRTRERAAAGRDEMYGAGAARSRPGEGQEALVRDDPGRVHDEVDIDDARSGQAPDPGVRAGAVEDHIPIRCPRSEGCARRYCASGD